MKTIDRLLIKAKKITNMVRVFLPFVVPDKKAADQVSKELAELCGDKPFQAIIIYGEDELSDDAVGVTIHHRESG